MLTFETPGPGNYYIQWTDIKKNAESIRLNNSTSDHAYGGWLIEP